MQWSLASWLEMVTNVPPVLCHQCRKVTGKGSQGCEVQSAPGLPVIIKNKPVTQENYFIGMQNGEYSSHRPILKKTPVTWTVVNLTLTSKRDTKSLDGFVISLDGSF